MAESKKWQWAGEAAEPDVMFTVDGATVAGRPGGSLVGALAVAGYTALRHSPAEGGARGVFCLMGSCQECLVHVNDAPVLACMEVVRAGMRVALDRVRAGHGAARVMTDAVVLGGGPAGIRAALALCGQGLRTVLVDEGLVPGGQVYRAPFGRTDGALAEAGSDLARGDRLRAALAGSGATVLSVIERGLPHRAGWRASGRTGRSSWKLRRWCWQWARRNGSCRCPAARCPA